MPCSWRGGPNFQRPSASPFFGVVVRLAASAADMERAWEIIADMAAPLSALARPGSNYFVPLANDGYPAADHEQDILNRQSRRSGMLLSMEELMNVEVDTVYGASKFQQKVTEAPSSITIRQVEISPAMVEDLFNSTRSLTCMSPSTWP